MSEIFEIIGQPASAKLVTSSITELRKRIDALPHLAQANFDPRMLYYRIEELETRHVGEIESLAKKWTLEAFEVDPSEITLIAELHNLNSMDFHPDQNFFPQATSKMHVTESVQKEIEKRRLINCLIAGAGHSCQNIYQMKDPELAEIDPALMENYKAVMLMAESQYWSMDNQTFEMAKRFSKPAGQVRIKSNQDGDTAITAQGVMLPVLLLELGKGIMQTIGRHGLPLDADVRRFVQEQADTLENELEETRIGKQMYRALIQSRTGEETKGRLVDFLYQIVKLPAPEFISRIKKAIDLLPE